MSHRLIARSADLLHLRNEGYHLEIRAGYLLIKEVPYVTAERQVKHEGILFAPLSTRVVDGQECSAVPETHVAYWTGSYPCRSNGQRITNFENPSAPQMLGDGLKADFTLSAKAPYRDYAHKMLAYLGWIVGEAEAIDPAATARTFPVYAAEEDDDVFHYLDTASSRVAIGVDNDRLRGQKVAIVGVGGTGSYVLDLVAKTHVEEIHLFDGDEFQPHNAFRAPGAWSLEELGHRKKKVDNYYEIYSKLRRRGLVAHAEPLTGGNLGLLAEVHFVFLCLDDGESKRTIVEWLVGQKIAFIDVGMGVTRAPAGLQGIVRVVTSTRDQSDHLNSRLSFGETPAQDGHEYDTNIQIAELNALNAALAVIKWKRLLGFYRNAGTEHYSGYQISTGEIVNEDR